MTWSNFIDSYLVIRTEVFAYLQSLVQTFQTKISVLLEGLPAWLEWVVPLLPEALTEQTLLWLLTSSIIPIVLVIFVIRIFT